MPLASLDLLLHRDHDTRVRTLWDALAERGLPSRSRHGSATNAPHVTLVTAPAFPPSLEARARLLAAPLVPSPWRVAGPVLLGRRSRVLALALIAPPGADRIVARLSRMSGQTDLGWFPHLTLAGGLDPEQAAAALALLATVPLPPSLQVTALRRWDPAAGITHPVLP